MLRGEASRRSPRIGRSRAVSLAVVGFGDGVGVLIGDVPVGRLEVLDDAQVRRRPVGTDLDRRRPEAKRSGEEFSRGGGVAAGRD